MHSLLAISSEARPENELRLCVATAATPGYGRRLYTDQSASRAAGRLPRW